MTARPSVTRVLGLALVVLLCGTVALVAGLRFPTQQASSSAVTGAIVPSAPTPTPRFAQLQSAGGSAASVATAAAAAAAAAGGGGDRSGSGSRARAGGEWWVKDPPWFLPPPPEWGPMPPTMYTSFFHKPRYPSLSTANYYPLYSREDEYDAHLPASMSRRAAHTQQLIYDHYVATYRDHMNGGPHAPLAYGDPNFGVRNPALFGHLGSDVGLSGAHTAAMHAQHPNNYFPGFSGPDHGAPSFVNGGAGGYGGAMALSGAFLEIDAGADTDAIADADDDADTATDEAASDSQAEDEMEDEAAADDTDEDADESNATD